jgi:hypothetical protein
VNRRQFFGMLLGSAGTQTVRSVKAQPPPSAFTFKDTNGLITTIRTDRRDDRTYIEIEANYPANVACRPADIFERDDR